MLIYKFFENLLNLQDITTIGNSLFFLGSRLGDSLLVQFTCGSGTSMLSSGPKEEVCGSRQLQFATCCDGIHINGALEISDLSSAAINIFDILIFTLFELIMYFILLPSIFQLTGHES